MVADNDAGPAATGNGAPPPTGDPGNPGNAKTDAKYTRVFADGFEDGTIDKWHDDGASVTSTQAHTGGKAAISNWDGTVVWNSPDALRGLSLESWPYQKEFLVRFWLKSDPDVDTARDSRGGKLFRLPWANPTDGNEFYWANLSSLFLTASVNAQALPSVWGESEALNDNAWHQVQVYIKDATDGAIRSWLDGHELTSTNSSGQGYPYFGNTHLNDKGWNNFYWPSNWSGADGCCDHDANNHLYLDDVEIFSDSPTGEPADGALSDATIHVR